MNVQPSNAPVLDTPPPYRTPSRRDTLLYLLRNFGTLFGLIGLIIYFTIRLPETFVGPNNWLNILQQMSMLAVVAFTMTAVMVMGDFDLSVGAMASLAGIGAALVFQQQPNEVSILQGIALALAMGIVGGLLNGFLVSYVGISPFVTTLGTMTMFSGLAFYISNGKTIFGRAIPAAFSGFSRTGLQLGTLNEQPLVLSNLTLVAVVVLVMIWVLLEQTIYGRRLYAIGGNREAARLSGISVRWLRLTAFMITGVGAAISGLMLVSRLASANPIQGDGLMLNAIAAVFLGTTMSEEGEPHVLGTLVGILILGVMSTGLTQLKIDSYIQKILTGAIIILAVTLSSISRRSR